MFEVCLQFGFLNICGDGSKTSDCDKGVTCIVSALKMSKDNMLSVHVSVFACERIGHPASLDQHFTDSFGFLEAFLDVGKRLCHLVCEVIYSYNVLIESGTYYNLVGSLVMLEFWQRSEGWIDNTVLHVGGEDEISYTMCNGIHGLMRQYMISKWQI